MNRIFLSSILLNFCVSYAVLAVSYDYCGKNKDSKKIVYFVDVQSIQNQSDQRVYLQGSKTILENKLEMGDRFIALKRGNTLGFSQVINKCIPGCKPQTFYQQIFGSDCQRVIVERDKKQFKSEWMQSIYLPVKTVNTTSVKSIVKEINAILAEYFTGSDETTTLYIYSKMNIDVSAEKDKLNRKFVELALDNEIPYAKNYSVVVFGVEENNQDVEWFWRDYFLAAGADTVQISYGMN